MSGVIFLKKLDTDVPTPPSNKGNLYYDSTAGTLRMKLDSGSVIDLGVQLSSTTPSTITDSTGSAGVATDAARSDHAHAHGNRDGGSLHAAATTSVNGFMSAADKTKLDGITTVTPTTRTLTAGAGLTGGGDLTADRTFNVVANADGSIVVNADDIQVGVISNTQHGTRGGGTLHAQATTLVDGFMSAADKTKLDGFPTSAVPTTRTLTAGAGLTGTGDLSADRTFNVVANADGSIVVNADDIQVGVLATDTQHGNRGNGSLHSVATTSVNGFMSAADKTKLDGFPTSAVPTTRTLTAGAGLAGGGDLSADRTFDVVANADGSIVANAGDIQVGVLATDTQHGNRGGGGIHSAATTSVNGFMSSADKTKLDGYHTRLTSVFATKTASATIANTETQVIGGTITTPFLVAGATYIIKAMGLLTNTTAASSSVVRIRIGTTTLTGNIAAGVTAANGTTARTNIPFTIEAMVTIKTTGTLGTAHGVVFYSVNNVVAPVISAPVAAAVTVDTTSSKLVEMTFISGAATTTANFISASIEALVL